MVGRTPLLVDGRMLSPCSWNRSLASPTALNFPSIRFCDCERRWDIGELSHFDLRPDSPSDCPVTALYDARTAGVHHQAVRCDDLHWHLWIAPCFVHLAVARPFLVCSGLSLDLKKLWSFRSHSQEPHVISCHCVKHQSRPRPLRKWRASILTSPSNPCCL